MSLYNTPRFNSPSIPRVALANAWSQPATPDEHRWHYLYVLPVLLLEFLAIALTRAVLPALLLDKFGSSVYIIMGICDCVRGFLAFCSCPLFGKISDVVGRRVCLFATVLGTCTPVCSLAFFSWEPGSSQEIAPIDGSEDAVDPSAFMPGDETFAPRGMSMHPHAITVFVILLSLSGVFSSTFTLVFAYISDTVKQQEERVSAYGLALATFGLSFTIGPMAGGYLAKSNPQLVFLSSLLLTILDLVYIYFVLPESRPIDPDLSSNISVLTTDQNFSWNPWTSLKLVFSDRFLRKVGQVAFFYYTGLWALISTLSVYAVQRFGLTSERLGELMSALGLSTMIAEAVLVRILVPMMGEKKAMKLGLLSFGIQCVVLGFAYESWHLFVCAFFSMLGNLVYPSLSSLVSGSVEPDAVGEALGAINGIKSVTEGIGPLFFGSLMTLSEHSALPGWPYLLAALFVLIAYQATNDLPDADDDDHIHELERKHRDDGGLLMRVFATRTYSDDEAEGLLSEIEDESDDYR